MSDLGHCYDCGNKIGPGDKVYPFHEHYLCRMCAVSRRVDLTDELKVPKRDIAAELTIMFTEEKAKAYDAGAMAAMDTVITLAQVSGGKVYTQQLINYKKHMQDLLSERNKQHEAQQANEAQVQPDQRVPSAKGLQPITGGPVYLAGGESPPTEEGQASSGVTQAEPEE